MDDNATVLLKGDASQLDNVLAASLGTLQGWGGKVLTIGKYVAGFFVAKKLFDFGTGMLSDAMEAQDAMQLLENTVNNLGDKAAMTAKQVDEFSTGIERTTKFTGEAATGVQTLFLRMGTLNSDAIKRATVASADLATVMGTDLKGAGDKLVKALKEPEMGINALRAAGIKFTDEEKAMVKALAEAGNEAAAQEIILSKLEGAIGGAAKEAGETASGKLERFKNILGDVGEQIGTAMLPAFTSIIDALSVFGDFVGSKVAPAIAIMIESFTEWGGAIISTVGPPLEWLGGMVVDVFMGAVSVTSDAISAIIGGLTAFGAALWDRIGPPLTKVFTFWQHIFGMIFGETVTATGSIVDMLGSLGSSILEVIMPPIEWLGEVFVTVFDAVVGAVDYAYGAVLPPLEGVVATILALGEIVVETGSIFASYFVESISAVGEIIASYLMPVIESLTGWLSDNLMPGVESAGGSLVGFGQSILDSVGPALKWFGDVAIVVFTAVQTAVQEFRNVAELALKGFILGVVQAAENIKHFFVEAIPAYLSWFGNNWKEIFVDAANIVKTVAANIWENLKNLWEGIKGLFSGEGFKFEMTPLLQGFERVSEEMPKIAERAKSDFEKGLEMDVGNLAGGLADAFDKNLATNRKRISDKLADKPNAPATPDATKPNALAKTPSEKGESPGLQKALADGAAALALKNADKEKGGKEKEGKTSAAFEDLLSVQKRIAGAAFGAGGDPQSAAIKKSGDKQAAIAEKQLKVAEKGNELVEQQTAELKQTREAVASSGTLQ